MWKAWTELFLPIVGKNRLEDVASNSKALVSDFKQPSVSLEDLIFEHFEPVLKQMPILCESSNNPLEFGAEECIWCANYSAALAFNFGWTGYGTLP